MASLIYSKKLSTFSNLNLCDATPSELSVYAAHVKKWKENFWFMLELAGGTLFSNEATCLKVFKVELPPHCA